MRRIPANPAQTAESFHWFVLEVRRLHFQSAMLDSVSQRFHHPLHRHHSRAFDQHHVAGQNRLAQVRQGLLDARAGDRPGTRHPRGPGAAGHVPGDTGRRRSATRPARCRRSALPNSQCKAADSSPSSPMSPLTTMRRPGASNSREQFQRRPHRRGVRVVGVVDDRGAANLLHLATHGHGAELVQSAGHRRPDRGPSSGPRPPPPAPPSRGGVPTPARRTGNRPRGTSSRP